VSGELKNRELPVVIIVGPTASGKTSLAVELAKQINAEIISADSRQIYKFLDVGTAKPNEEEKGGVVHYGFDIVRPDQDYSAGMFATDARKWVAEIRAKNKNVVVAGGSGLYADALIDGFFSGNDAKDDSVRKELEERIDVEGIESLYAVLMDVDPEYAQKINPLDRQRIQRALEVYYVSGELFSDVHRRERDKADFQSVWFGIKWPRDLLYERINRRVDIMFDGGLLEEVRSVVDRGYKNMNALKSVGYEEIFDLFDGKYSTIAETKEAIKKNTRHYAKRQMTWFKRSNRIQWLDASELNFNQMLEQILESLD